MLNEILKLVDVDKLVTADTRRIIRLPGTLHGTSGWCCTRIQGQCFTPVKKWIGLLLKHEKAIDIPKNTNLWSMFQKLKSSSNPEDDSKISEQQDAKILEMQVSSQVVGVSNRSSFIAWLPNKLTENDDNHLFSKMKVLIDADLQIQKPKGRSDHRA